MKKLDVKVGSEVAFNDLKDAVWWTVLEIDGFIMKVREVGTDHVPQRMDKSLVKQVRREKDMFIYTRSGQRIVTWWCEHTTSKNYPWKTYNDYGPLGQWKERVDAINQLRELITARGDVITKEEEKYI